MPLADYETLVPRFLRDQSGQITPADIARAIAAAVRQYGGDKPRELVREVQWAGGHFGPVPELFTAESRVLGAEYPAGQVPPAMVQVVAALGVDGLGLVSEQTLAAGATVQLRFTAGHVLDDDTDTVPGAHRDAVAMFAASQLLRELATYYSGERETSIGADGSNTESRARNYAARAKELRAAYFGVLRIQDPAAAGGAASAAAAGQSASAVTSWPTRDRGWVRNSW